MPVKYTRLAATSFVLLTLACGCSSRSGLEAAYYKCVSTFGEELDPNDEGLVLGPPEDYLTLQGNVLSVTTPTSQEPGVGVLGAEDAVLCVMDELDAPDDMRREAAAGSSDGSGTWADFTASWKHPDLMTTELRVIDE
jgi:hypothetical protein